MVFSYFLVFLSSLLLLFGILYLIEGIFYHGSKRVVYMGSNLREQGESLRLLVRKYLGDETKNYTLVEPGSGIATVSTYLAQHFLWKKVEAIELRRTVFWMGRLRNMLFYSKTPIAFIKKDLFDYEAPQNSVFYCYLTTTILDQMYQKGQLDGCLVVCLTFSITDLEPTEKIPLSSWQKALYVYDLRNLTGLAYKTKAKKDKEKTDNKTSETR